MLVVIVCEKQNKKFRDGLSCVKSIIWSLDQLKKVCEKHWKGQYETTHGVYSLYYISIHYDSQEIYVWDR